MDPTLSLYCKAKMKVNKSKIMDGKKMFKLKYGLKEKYDYGYNDIFVLILPKYDWLRNNCEMNEY